MQHVISTQKINLTRHDYYSARTSVITNSIKRFIAWCDAQETNRFLWLGVAVPAGIGAVVPVTLCAVVFIGGNSLALWALTCAINVPVLIINLAAQPTKITLPFLFFAWFADAVIIAYCIAAFS